MADNKLEGTLDSLFEKASEVVSSLGEEFSTEDFRERIAQRNQAAYTELLNLCKGKTYPFAVAHYHISQRLRKVAPSLGYELSVSERKSQSDTFGNDQEYDIFKKV